jgi:hypothetical protein
MTDSDEDDKKEIFLDYKKIKEEAAEKKKKDMEEWEEE